MNRTYSALALSALAMGAVVLTATDAAAMLKDPDRGTTAAPATADAWPDEGSGYPIYDPTYKVPSVQAELAQDPSDDNGFDGVQLGASAVGGAGVALAGVWLYRRRHVLAG